MIFWIFVILTILGLVIAGLFTFFSGKYLHGDDNKFFKFCFNNEVLIVAPSIVISILCGVVSAIMLIGIINIQVCSNGEKANMEQKYKALIYKSQTESIRDEFGVVNKEYIDEVQHWNEDISEYKANSDNVWIDIFYPKKVIDGVDTIDLENIKIEDEN